jgi:hypothetical protein
MLAAPQARIEPPQGRGPIGHHHLHTNITMLNSYFPRQHSRRSVPLLTSDEVRPIAANTAKLPWLPKRRDG